MNRIGRPSKYKPEYCGQIIELMSQGYSKEAVAGDWDVSKQRIYDWEEKYPEFRDAIKIAEAKCLKFFETVGLDGMKGRIPGFNPATWIFQMKNRFGWSDRQSLQHQIDGQQIQVVFHDSLRINRPNEQTSSNSNRIDG